MYYYTNIDIHLSIKLLTCSRACRACSIGLILTSAVSPLAISASSPNHVTHGVHADTINYCLNYCIYIVLKINQTTDTIVLIGGIYCIYYVSFGVSLPELEKSGIRNGHQREEKQLNGRLSSLLLSSISFISFFYLV